MSHESEFKTRKKRIDPQLKACGWKITPFDGVRPLASYSNHAIEEFPTDAGPADYLLVLDGQPIGIVEAKRVTISPDGVLTES